MTKATARGVLAAWCSGLLCSLGVLVFVIVLTEQFHASLRESVLAMNDPARLAHFERALQEGRKLASRDYLDEMLGRLD